MSKVAVLYWDSNHTFKILYKKLSDGNIRHRVGKDMKTFVVDKVKPYWFWKKKILWGRKATPAYILRHDDTVPFVFNWERENGEGPQVRLTKDGGKVKDIVLKETLTPDNMTEIIEQKTLKTALSLQGASMKDNFMWMIIGVAIALPIGIIVGPMLGI